jgi:hypothetical protein
LPLEGAALDEGGDMTKTSEMVNRDFKVWMAMTLGLIKDGRMGVSQARAERIRTALSYSKKGS